MANRQSTGTSLQQRLGGKGGFAVLVLLLNVLVTSLVVIAVRWPPPGAVRIEVATVATAGSVSVVVGGQVASPGVYRLVEPATVSDAIAAAGGALDEAATDADDLAARVSEGQQVWVGASGGGESERIDINSAGAEQLEALPGIGPALAARVVAYREEHGSFSTVEELLNVKGIGDATLERIRSQVEVR